MENIKEEDIQKIIDRSIYLSIHKEALDNIASGLKNHEFRNYIPKKPFEYVFVYETAPESKIKYILKIKKTLDINQKIEYIGIGNSEFNAKTKSNFAYQISKVYQIGEYLSLEKLKNQYNFTPPQAYAYGNKYNELSKFIIQQKRNLLWEI